MFVDEQGSSSRLVGDDDTTACFMHALILVSRGCSSCSDDMGTASFKGLEKGWRER